MNMISLLTLVIHFTQKNLAMKNWYEDFYFEHFRQFTTGIPSKYFSWLDGCCQSRGLAVLMQAMADRREVEREE